MDHLLSQPIISIERDLLREVQRIIVVGDLHGDATALAQVIRLFNPASDLVIFIGDYADRGDAGVEVIERILPMLIRYPDRVVALQGNHEVFSARSDPQFGPCHLVDEAIEKWGSWEIFFEAVFKPFVGRLRLAAIIPGEILFVHGGVSGRIEDCGSLMDPSTQLVEDVLHSDCTVQHTDEQHNSRRGKGVRFGSQVTAAVCERLDVKRIIRGHQHGLGGQHPGVMHDTRLVTVITGKAYAKKPYVLCLSPKDTTSISMITLETGEEQQLDFEELSESTLRNAIETLSKKEISQDQSKAIHNLKEKLRRKVILPSSALRDVPGLPKPDPGFGYYRFTLDELLTGKPPKATAQKIFIAMFDTRSRKLKGLYFSLYGISPGSFRRD